MLDKMGHELETLRKLLKAREEKMNSAGISMESHADVLDRQFWAAVPESGKRAVLTSSEAWCIPPRNVQQYVEELLGRGESAMAGDVLLKYASCVRNKDAQARKKAAIGLGQLAELYSKAASQRLQDALAQIGQQLVAEKDPELQTLLGAAFVRLSQEAAQRRYYRAMQQSLDSLADLEELRPTWAHSLRPRIGVENRLPEFVEEALTAEAMPEGLVAVLSRIPEGAGEHLAARLSRSGRRTERESIVQLAKAVGGACARHLREIFKSEAPAKAVVVAGLLSRLDPASMEELLPMRLRHSGRSFHDVLVRQLSISGAPERGRLLANSLELLDVAAVSLALDEIGMCGDPATAATMLRLAEGDILPQGADYLRVKAIEALGRMRAPDAVGPLRKFVEDAQDFRLDVSRRNSHGGCPGADENRARVDAAVPAGIGAGRRRDDAGAARRDSRTRRGAASPLPENPAAAQRAGGADFGARQVSIVDQRDEPRRRAADRGRPAGGGNGSDAEDSRGTAIDQHAGRGEIRAAASSRIRDGRNGARRPLEIAAAAGLAGGRRR